MCGEKKSGKDRADHVCGLRLIDSRCRCVSLTAHCTLSRWCWSLDRRMESD